MEKLSGDVIDERHCVGISVEQEAPKHAERGQLFPAAMSSPPILYKLVQAFEIAEIQLSNTR
jgi:predicted flavoprotein YhiN